MSFKFAEKMAVFYRRYNQITDFSFFNQNYILGLDRGNGPTTMTLAIAEYFVNFRRAVYKQIYFLSEQSEQLQDEELLVGLPYTRFEIICQKIFVFSVFFEIRI